ncbi:DNA mismatch repair endonuclease MutL [Lacipirellula limnantheis]|uniref:DNA mismatch repair protein MutL n=1 Tax=Lacipirellula limnantheis TaxID=2528024 RepID=A0A517U163_9BACT|nr:DNA mismatch repair endonuclease MutL [Lacipirellula limnantheis]QDT74343.1 DNA mismatch repair protein MutL [Lacipirellula limnantheis]
MPTIRQLPPSVVNKIAAGEVIERPASVVKELVENSLDAGARRIDVTVEQGGTELIRVVDDGCGVAPEQLELALASHATSKIVDADDLFCVATLGFRGEALASIAAVSRLSFRSRPIDAPIATELEVVGGAAEPLRPVGGPCGTTVEVRHLFFNTPVRQKFLRTTQTEMGHLTEALARLALAHPRVHFTLQHGGRLIHDLPPGDSRQRIAALCGQELADGLIHIESDDDGIQLTGDVANPSHSRPNNRMQYLFLNGRFIRDRSLQHALGEAYRGLLLTGRFPVCFLHLQMPAAAVDVNVHPTKLEVRFQDGGRVYSQLLSTLRTKFLSTDLIARASSAPAGSAADDEILAATPAASQGLWDWAKRQLGPATGDGRVPEFVPFADRDQRDALRLHRVDLPPLVGRTPSAASSREANIIPNDQGGDLESTTSDRTADYASAAAERLDRPHGAPQAHGSPRALQIHNRYLVTETDEGLEVIDQHALHERILYETLRERVLAGAVESQRLLVPEPVDLAASEAAAAVENRAVLAQLGMEVEAFGGETVLVSAYPAMLANLPPAEVLRSLVDQLLAGGKQPESRDILDELLHMIACKAAVKYGDRLTPQEIDALLEQRGLAQDHHHCPHGRPTALIFTREQLDRQFKRI